MPSADRFSDKDTNKSIRTGVASHICAASAGILVMIFHNQSWKESPLAMEFGFVPLAL
jgi:hypothetical protein